MFQKILMLAALAVPAGLPAQNQPYPGAPPPQAPATVNVVTPPGPNVYVVSGGLYGTGLYPLPYLPMAPSQNAAPPQAGTAGISFNSPTTYSGPGYSYSTPLYYSNAASPYYNATPVAPGSETVLAETGRQINDFAPSYYVSASAATVAAAPAPSVAEVAAQYRTQAPRVARSYSNADAGRLIGSLEISDVLVIGNMPSPESQTAAEAEQPQPTQPAATAGGQTQPSTTTAPTSAPATQAQPSNQPQTAPPADHTEQSGNPSALPATSTLLPLLGTLGLLSGALGLWIARSRR